MHADVDLTQPGSEPSSPPDAEAHHTASVEVVRQALVRLRGGAPFLSSADGALLVRWLDEGVPVWKILHGLDAAARQRHARRIRAPLALAHAARHLGRPRAIDVPPVVAEPAVADHPLAPIAAALRVATPPPGLEEACARLAAALRSLPTDDADALRDAAATRIVAFLDQGWHTIDAGERRRFHADARTHLTDVLADLDEARADALVEEHARGLWRQAWPALSLTLLWRLV
ncbi:MAG: hypothetical protein H6733_11220 [Alphaproteobacteria bacterium]|nr:hypothetical protein [Alphaproteobacteria bacterium]